ncbi:MAG TPA: 2'-5' RNA ligase family protein [Ktedonobacterales bacterium]
MAMQGIVSLLDDASERAVRALWAELETRHDLREAPRSVPFPHCSYQIAAEYDLATLGAILSQVAARHAPFSVDVSGLGAFEAPEPVLYLAVRRNAALDALHAALWRALVEGGVAREWSPLYAPDSWVPHITLAQRDLTPEGLRAIQSAWADRDLRREVRFSDLTLGVQAPGQAAQRPLLRFPLGGSASGQVGGPAN